MTNLPPIPDGFELVQQDLPPIPDGFQLVGSAPGQAFAPAEDANKPSVALDVAKQIPAGLVKGAENIATGPAHIANLAGQGADWLLNKVGYEADPQAAQNQQALRTLATANSKGGIDQYLPQPETTAGKYARGGAEMVPQALALKGGLAPNAAIGVASGVGGEAGRQAFEDTAAEPYAQIAGTLLGGYSGSKTADALAKRAARTSAPASAQKIEALKTASTPVYKELTATGNDIAMPKEAGAQIVKDISAELHPQALRPTSAPRTYNKLKELNAAQDLNDVAIVRDNLRDVANGIAEDRLIRVTGPDSRAARQAMKSLDAQMDSLSPGWTGKMAEADSNWAAAKRIETVQEEAGKGNYGRLGSFDSSALRTKGYTRDEIAAIKRAHTGGPVGVALNAIGGGLNPFHGGLGPTVQAAMHLPAAFSTGGMSLLGSAAGVPVGMLADKGAAALRHRALDKAYSKLADRSALGKSGAGDFVYTAPPTHLNSLLLGGLQAPRQIDEYESPTDRLDRIFRSQ